jgi:hypothetical protein
LFAALCLLRVVLYFSLTAHRSELTVVFIRLENLQFGWKNKMGLSQKLRQPQLIFLNNETINI